MAARGTMTNSSLKLGTISLLRAFGDQGPVLWLLMVVANGPGAGERRGTSNLRRVDHPAGKTHAVRKAGCRLRFRDRSKTREKATPAGVRRRNTRQAAGQPMKLRCAVIRLLPR